MTFPEGCRGMQKKIMVVEDYDDTRFMLEKLLSGRGYEVVLCENGSDAIIKFIQCFRCEPNAGILMDLRLPDINGLRVMTAIRELERGATSHCEPIRMGVISATTEIVEGVDSYESLGVTLSLKKPLDPATLPADVERWLAAPVPDLYRPRPRIAFASGASNYGGTGG
jgi:adenylate cyclase